jgi:hypothetical protein
VTVVDAVTARKAIGPTGEAPMFAGRRRRFWIVGDPLGCELENVAPRLVAVEPAENVALPLSPELIGP